MKEKIIIYGTGQIGTLYKDFFDEKLLDSVLLPTNITNSSALEKDVRKYKPSIIINTAAQTNLEWCSQNKLKTFKDNVLGADTVAKVCDQYGIYYIYFSSGCIFESKNERDTKKEDDIPNPGSYYAWTKVWSENLIRFEKSEDFRYLILRPRQPISTEVHYKNMLMKMLTFSRFIDTPNTGTVIEDLLDWTLTFIKKKPVGILHVANEGWATPLEIGLLLKKYVLPSMRFKKITKKELDKITPNRRVDTVLDVSKLKSIVGAQNVVPYRNRLIYVVKKFGENIKNADKRLLRKQMRMTVKQSKARTVVNEAWKELIK